MGPPHSIKDVQKLTGCKVALNRFISRLGEKELSFFRLLKLSRKFEWSDEANGDFEKLKVYLTSSHVLTPPVKQEPYYYTMLQLPMWSAQQNSSRTGRARSRI
jgi:hypothetical protein